MTIKTIELNDLHPANPLVEVINTVNENFHTLIQGCEAFWEPAPYMGDLDGGPGVIWYWVR